ncbi:MAG: cob(I)yrinic acid a,c-diamide adenosyltransferase [Cyanobacteria bacterium REEB459]|nr:cob(I)yrinic acid a,c-diamide adenosyltransferase [Cyanobacteria bacterium REEB459]
MVFQLQVPSLHPPSTSVVRHPLLQTIEGSVQVFTSLHRNFFTDVMVQSLRIADQGKLVLVVQLLKGGMHQGPDQPTQLGQNLDWIRPDIPRCLDGSILAEEDRQAVRDLWNHTRNAVAKGRYGLVVLDEVSLALNYGLIAMEDLLDLIEQRPPEVDVILTGPAMPAELLNLADQVTQFRRNFLT